VDEQIVAASSVDFRKKADDSATKDLGSISLFKFNEETVHVEHAAGEAPYKRQKKDEEVAKLEPYF